MMQEWFKKAKLGIFIHYGIYAVGDVSESWSFHNGNISYEDYMKQCEGFTASNYDPKAWAELFKKAGAQYVVMTSKHHDGVALFDTKYSDLSVVKKTPAGKDLVKGFFISGFTVAIVFSPWLAVTCRQFILRMRYDDGSTAELATLNSVMDYFKEWFSAVETPIGIVVLLGMALCLVLSYGAVDWVRQHHNAAPAIAAAAFALTGIVGGVISATVNNCFMGRYAFPGMGFVMLWYAVGFAQILESNGTNGRKWWAGGILGTVCLCFLFQYSSEIRLEYDGGLETYENFVETQMTDNDAVIGPYTHTIFLNVYHPELHYYLVRYKLYSLPFVNTDALTDYSQLDPYENLWYICFQGGTPNELEDEYDYEEALEFHYMYYDFVIYRLEPKTIEQQQ